MWRNIFERISPSFQVHTIFEDDTTQSQFYGEGSGAMITFVPGLEPTLDAQLREAVRRPAPAFIGETLEADILNHLDLHEWRLSVIQSAVLFEAWLSRFVRSRFASKGVSPNEIDAKFRKPGSGEPRNATFIAAVLFKEVTMFDFSATPEFSEWKTKVRDLRNSLVHGERFNVTQVEAEEAYQAVVSSIRLLQTN